MSETAEELREAFHRYAASSDVFLRVTAGDGAYRKGGKGEVLVGKRLEKLSDEWRVLRSIPVGNKGTDIDHLVIGPGGVFSLNTSGIIRAKECGSAHGLQSERLATQPVSSG